jgi:hypothetical protein
LLSSTNKPTNMKKPERDIEKASGAEAYDDDEDISGPKKGSICCGCCCDHRIAVLALSAITIIFSIVGFAVESLTTTGQLKSVNFADDEFASDVTDIVQSYVVPYLVVSIISIVSAILAFLGALKYNIYLVSLTFNIYRYYRYYRYPVPIPGFD